MKMTGKELESVLKEGEKFRIQRDFFRIGQIAFFNSKFRRPYHSKNSAVNGAVKKQALLQRIFSNIIHSA